MKLYRALRTIDHGDADGKVTSYAPGDEVPAKLAKALPKLVEVIEIDGVERVITQKPADPDKPKPLSRMNQEELKARATELGISLEGLDTNDDLRKAIEAKEAEAQGGGQGQQKTED